tara:strand:+ start:5426 stop:6382 length:957 start_codon:yes stop_codon:yes gene_type:complete
MRSHKLSINNKNNQKNQFKYLGFSLLFHLLLVFILLANVVIISKSDNYKSFISSNTKSNQIKKNSQVEPINAVTIAKDDIEREVARIKQLDINKKQKEESRVKDLNSKIAALNKANNLAKKKYNKIKQDEQNTLLSLHRKKNSLEKSLTEMEAKKQEASEEVKIVKQRADYLKKKLQKEAARKRLLAELQEKQEKRMLDILSEEEKGLNQEQEKLSLKKQQIVKFIILQRNKVSKNWLAQDHFIGKNLETKLEIALSSSGEVLSVNIIKSSGDGALDLSAKNAILKSSPLPVPNEREIFEEFKKYRFTFKPDELKMIN